MDRVYFARQLNGPVITGLFNSVYDFFHKKLLFDSNADYFKNLSIETADSYQLNMIGQLMGLQRLKIIGVDITPIGNLQYTKDYVQQEKYEDTIGFAEEYVNRLEDTDYPAGMFTSNQYGSGIVVALPIEQYRKLLLAVSKSQNVCSLLFITELIYIIFSSSDFKIEQASADSFKILYGDTIQPVLVSQLRIILSKVYSDYIQFTID